MNGPSIHIQRLMERPRANRRELSDYLTRNITRTETLAVLALK